MQRTRLDVTEVGGQRPELRAVLDPPHQVVVGRVVLVNDRRTTQTSVVYDEVDVVPGQTSFARPSLRHLDSHRSRWSGILRFDQLSALFDDVRPHRIQVIEHVRRVLVLLVQLVQQVGDCVLRHLPFQLVYPFLPLALPAWHLAQCLLGFLLERLYLGLDLFLLLVRQVAELVTRHDLTIAQRGKRHPDRAAQQHQPLLLGALFDVAQLLPGTLLEFLLDYLTPRLILLALERRREPGMQSLGQRDHVATKIGTSPCGEPHQTWCAGIFEIVHVAQVWRDRPRGCVAFEIVTHQGMLAGARRS